MPRLNHRYNGRIHLLRSLCLVVFLAATLTLSLPASGAEAVRVGVLSHRPKAQDQGKWQPLAAALKEEIPEREFVVTTMTYPELDRAVASRQVDFVLTSPGHYFLLAKNSGLSSPLATLAADLEGQRSTVLGGVIFTRADRSTVTTLRDIKGKRVAVVDPRFFAGYQIQAYELFRAGLRLPADLTASPTGTTFDAVVEAVLAGHAEVGFVQTGVLEHMAREGKLDLEQIKVINRQDLPGFPVLLSTRLYPEYPFSALPHIDDQLAHDVTTVLFQLHKKHPAILRAIGIEGFTVPANYAPVASLLRELRLPPYDAPPHFTLHDVWNRYRVGIGAGLLAIGVILALMVRLLLTQRVLAKEQHLVRLQQQQLRQSEERHRLLADNSIDVIWTMNLDGSFTYLSPSVEKMRGYTPDEIMRIPLEEQFPPASLARVREGLSSARAAVQAGRPLEFRDVELEEFHKDGSTVRTEVTASFLLAADGSFQEILGVTREISERIKAQEQLQAARSAAEAASRAKSEFLANMSHEIRTPMNGVLGLAQLLEKEPLTPGQRDMVRRILAAGRSLLGLINDILDFSKIEAGQLQLEARPFALAPLLEQLDSLQGGLARAKRLSFRVEAAALPDGGLVGDALRLEQVLLNLIGNAIKFTEQGEIVVRVVTQTATGTEARLRFEVRDTGPGISPEVLTTLFKPFTQADGSITRRFGGTGLGLSICKRLVELMGGTIGVESGTGTGSVFWFEITFGRTTEVAAEPFTGARDVLHARPRLSGVKILVVDDNEINRDLLARVLQREGAEAELVGDGQQAITSLRESPRCFDAVLMDIQMPVMDGLTATRLIRSDLGLTDLPVITLTAGVLPEERQNALKAGVDDFLTKPVDLEKMVSVLHRWLPALPMEDDIPGPAPAGETPEHTTADLSGDLPAIPGIDTSSVADLYDNDREFFLELLELFITGFADTADMVRSTLARGDQEAATRRLHALKGSAGNLGARELMESARKLEEAILAGAPETGSLLEEFSARFASLQEASSPWVRKSDGPVPSAAG